MLNGIPSSPGVYMGAAVVEYSKVDINYNEVINDSEIEANISKFISASRELSDDYTAIISELDKTQPNIATILESNLMLINDDILNKDIINYIKKGFSAESAITLFYDQQRNFLLSTKDSILRERAFEIDNIKDRLLDIIWGRKGLFQVSKGDILVVRNITPSELIHYQSMGIAGLITEVGGLTSHCSILARSYEIPAVIGVKDACSKIKTGDTIIINGYAGVVIVNPNVEATSHYNLKKIIEKEHQDRLGQIRNLPSETKDGRYIKIMSNVDTVRDIDNTVKTKSDGVGLVRTESLILGLNTFPDEESQYVSYSQFADRAFPHAITFRAFDIGSDKFTSETNFHEDNPALGVRGIRFLLGREDVFKTQIRAILRASANKNVRFMLPMIINLPELKATLDLIEICKNELKAEGQMFDSRMPVGIMIETPAAAIISDILAKNCDFFSIGTNDLTQYVLASDRNNEHLSDSYDTLHPAVLRLIKITIDNAEDAGIDLSICGEIAGRFEATKLLVGMGVKSLSVSPSIQLNLKKNLRSMSYKNAKTFAKNVLKCETPEEVRQLISANHP